MQLNIPLEAESHLRVSELPQSLRGYDLETEQELTSHDWKLLYHIKKAAREQLLLTFSVPRSTDS
tara:strand:- start:1624 stop:1818 length:195 start_codon:yes stop_codon:yes gene_type:complete